MKTKHIILFLLIGLAICGCGPSYDDVKKQSQAEQARLRKEDSLALKIGVMPTLDCIPA